MTSSIDFKKFLLLLIIAILVSNFFLVKSADFAANHVNRFYTFFPPSGMDFNVDYIAAKYLLMGLNIYEEHPETGYKWAMMSYSYTPLVAYLFVPFTVFTEPVAYRVWVGCIVLITFFSLLLFSKYFEDKLLYWATMLMISLFSYPFNFTLERGNIDHLMFLCIILVFFFYADKRNDMLVGLFLSLGVLMKLYPGIFILYFFIKKEWKILMWTCLFGVILLLLTSKNALYVSFYEYIRWYMKHTYVANVNHSLYSILSLINGALSEGAFTKARVEMGLQLGGLDIALFTTIHMKIGLFILYIVAGYILIEKRLRNLKNIFLEFSMCLILMTITPQTSHDYNLIIIVFATIAILYHYQIFFQKCQRLTKVDITCMALFIFSTIYLYINPILNLVESNKVLFLLANKFFPLMIYFGLIAYLLLRHSDIPAKHSKKNIGKGRENAS